MKCYKIVTKSRDGQLKSFNYSCEASLIYTPGKVTHPKIANSKIFVFKELFHALEFLKFVGGGWPNQELWEVEGLKPRKLKWISLWDRECDFIRFWLNKKRVSTCVAPVGTYAAEEIKLIKPLFYYDRELMTAMEIT